MQNVYEITYSVKETEGMVERIVTDSFEKAYEHAKKDGNRIISIKIDIAVRVI